MKKLLIGALALPFILFGCSTNKIDGTVGGAEGSASLMLTKNSEVEYVNSEKGDPLFQVPDLADFSVIFYDSKGEHYGGFTKFSEMPEQVRLKEGNYTLKAYYGYNKPVAFDEPYYEGTADFKVTGGSNTPVAVISRLANVLIKVNYSDRFKEVFGNYSLDVMSEHTVDDNGSYYSLNFKGNDKRVGFVKVAETIYLSLQVTKKDNGEVYRYGAEPIKGAKGGEFYNLMFDSDANGNATLNITITDDTESRDYPVKLDQDFMPKGEPVINTTINTDAPYGFRFGMYDGSPVVAVLKAQGRIKNVLMDVDSEYASSIGVPAHVDFLNMSDAERNALTSLGIEWTEDMIGRDNGTLRFTKMLSELDPSVAASLSENKFVITLVDSYDREAEETFEFRILPLTVSLHGINDYDVWASTASFAPATFNEDITPEELGEMDVKYQVSTDKNTWISVAHATNDSGQTELTGLKDGTHYYARVFVNNVVSSDIIEFTTEEAKNFPNASFEDYYAEKFVETGLSSSVVLYPYAQGDSDPFWCTLNEFTTYQKDENYWMSYPCVELSDDATDGNVALKIQTVGWGPGSKCSSYGTVTSANRTPGKLFIGDYEFIDGDLPLGNNGIIKGKPFNSRPKTISFDYRYYAYKKIFLIGGGKNTMEVKAVIENRDGDEPVVIADAEFSRTVDSETLTSYTTQTLELDYKRTDLKATHIYMVFQSQPDNEKIATNETVTTDTKEEGAAKNQARKVTGSYILLDNIVVGY